MQVVILAGGLATRLKLMTKKIPKSMIEIEGKPFLAYQLELLKKNCIEEVVLCVGYLSEPIKEYFGDGSKFGLKIIYSCEKNQLLGTGGAIKNAEKYLNNDFAIMYGDSYLPIDFNAVFKFYNQTGLPACMTVYKNCSAYDTSNVILQNNKIILYDKKHPIPAMQYIDYGLSVFSKRLLALLPNGMVYDLADLFSKLAKNGQLAGFEVMERFYEIGSFIGLENFTKYVRENNIYKS